jgi:hypothetical protein
MPSYTIFNKKKFYGTLTRSLGTTGFFFIFFSSHETETGVPEQKIWSSEISS